MSNLQDIRRRMGSIRATRKIMAAMKMIAAARVRRLQDPVDRLKIMADTLSGMTAAVLRAADTVPALYSGSKSGEASGAPHKIIVLTADQGLCGGFTGNIVRAVTGTVHTGSLRHVFPDTAAADDELRGCSWIIAGRKGEQRLQKIPDVHFIAAEDFLPLVMQTVNNYMTDPAGKLSVISVSFKNMLVQPITLTQLLPMAGLMTAHAQTQDTQPIPLIEPVADEALPLMMKSLIRLKAEQLLAAHNLCEQIARMQAMDTATRNADDMLRSLELHYNRTRQSQITAELIEVISGAAATG